MPELGLKLDSYLYILGNGGKAFVPTDINGCVLWLRADGIIGLSDGDPVGTWADESGSGNDISQATESAKNGKPAVLFDGIDDWLQGFFTWTQPQDIFVVLKVVTIGQNKYIWDAAATHNHMVFITYTPSTVKLYAGGFVTSSETLDTNAHIWHTVFNGASSKIAMDDNTPDTGNVGAGTSSGGLTLAGDGSAGSGSWTNIYVCEIVGYDNVLSSVDEDFVWNGLNAMDTTKEAYVVA